MPRIYKNISPSENKVMTPAKEIKKQEPKAQKPAKDDDKKDNSEN